jgi:hypothetical protein
MASGRKSFSCLADELDALRVISSEMKEIKVSNRFLVLLLGLRKSMALQAIVELNTYPLSRPLKIELCAHEYKNLKKSRRTAITDFIRSAELLKTNSASFLADFYIFDVFKSLNDTLNRDSFLFKSIAVLESNWPNRESIVNELNNKLSLDSSRLANELETLLQRPKTDVRPIQANQLNREVEEEEEDEPSIEAKSALAKPIEVDRVALSKPDRLPLKQTLILKHTGHCWTKVAAGDYLNEPDSFLFSIASYNALSTKNLIKSIDNILRSTYGEMGVRNLHKIDRISKLVDYIDESMPWFIMLQECDQEEESALMSAAVVQKGYYVCTERRQESLYNSNCIVLSRLRPKYSKLIKLKQDSKKTCIIAKFQYRVDDNKCKELLLVNVHLNSIKKDNNLEKRKLQLQTLKKYLVDLKDEFDLDADYAFIAGDFNFDDSAQVENQQLKELFLSVDDASDSCGYVDLFENVNTFDPTRNFTAAISSIKKHPRRLDRMLFKASTKNNNDCRSLIKSLTFFNTRPFKIDCNQLIAPIVYPPYASIKRYTSSNRLKSDELLNESVEFEKNVEENEFFLHPSDHYGLECLAELN